MKKFVFPFCLILLFFVFFSACDNSQQNPSEEYGSDWVEVQSITYNLNDSTYTLTSAYIIDYNNEEITENEYNQVPEDLHQGRLYSGNGKLTVNRNEFLSYAKQCVDTYHYFIQYKTEYDPITNEWTTTPSSYWKYKVEYTLYYVQLRFLSDNSIEIKYCDINESLNTNPSEEVIISILPSSYKITYFAD